MLGSDAARAWRKSDSERRISSTATATVVLRASARSTACPREIRGASGSGSMGGEGAGAAIAGGGGRDEGAAGAFCASDGALTVSASSAGARLRQRRSDMGRGRGARGVVALVVGRRALGEP